MAFATSGCCHMSTPWMSTWPASGRSSPGRHAEGGRLAGAVRADEAVEAAGRHIQIDPVDRDLLAEPLVQSADPDREPVVLGHAHPLTSSGRSSLARPVGLSLSARRTLGRRPLAAGRLFRSDAARRGAPGRSRACRIRRSAGEGTPAIGVIRRPCAERMGKPLDSRRPVGMHYGIVAIRRHGLRSGPFERKKRISNEKGTGAPGALVKSLHRCISVRCGKVSILSLLNPGGRESRTSSLGRGRPLRHH